jgi:5-dehydro-4-deoxyglucarate dehydratase
MINSQSPAEIARTLSAGLLSFPVTHFKADLSFDEPQYREHCDWLLQHGVTGLFAAGGTGEFFALTPQEALTVCRAAVEETRGRVPVIAGCGYGTALAVEMAKGAEKAGANGILLLPPYLMTPSQAGLAAHIQAVCKATSLAVIVYNRDNAVVNEDTLAQLCEQCPNLVGFKDGVGDVELMMRVYSRLGDRLVYIGGLPTAETFAMPYLEMGVTTYSSAIFNFLPDWALSFYQAVRARDHARVIHELNVFVLPYIAIRNRGRGYAVSIVKAGCTVVGRHAGPVRPPLTDLTPAELSELRALIDKVRSRASAAEARRLAQR